MRPRIQRRPRQLGGAAVEFAFVFPFLFFLMYGVLVYSYLFVLQESINFAAQEAAEAAVKVDESGANADTLRVRFARETAAQMIVDEQPKAHQPCGSVFWAVRQHKTQRPDNVRCRV